MDTVDRQEPVQVDRSAAFWRARSVGAGLGGATLATLCCLPQAAAIALGLSLSTAASLGGLLAYQRAFQAAGVGLALVAIWAILRRSRIVCPLPPEERQRVPTLVLVTFAVSFVALNLAVIPFLEQLPWLLSRR